MRRRDGLAEGFGDFLLGEAGKEFLEDAPGHRTERPVADEQAAIHEQPPVEGANAAQDRRGQPQLREGEVRGRAHAVQHEDGLGVRVQREARPDAVGDAKPGVVDLVVLGGGEFLVGDPPVAHAMGLEFPHAFDDADRGVADIELHGGGVFPLEHGADQPLVGLAIWHEVVFPPQAPAAHAVRLEGLVLEHPHGSHPLHVIGLQEVLHPLAKMGQRRVGLVGRELIEVVP